MRIAHLSDLHIYAPDSMRVSEFFTHGLPNRRWLGGANFVLGRAGVHSVEVLRAAVAAVGDARADHCVVTGDLSNLAIDAEFAFVRSILSPLGGPDRLSVVPGNHDYYTPEAVRAARFEKHYGDLVFGAGTDNSGTPAVAPGAGAFAWPYPAFKDFDGCRLILARTPAATPPGFSWGRLGEQQMAEINRLSVEAAGQGRYVVLAQHHHLHDRGDVHELTGPFKDCAAELAMLMRSPVGVIIHGHDHAHRDWVVPSGHPSGRTRVICCGSSSYLDRRRGRMGRMTVLDITDGVLRVEKWMYQPEAERFVLSENE